MSKTTSGGVLSSTTTNSMCGITSRRTSSSASATVWIASGSSCQECPPSGCRSSGTHGAAPRGGGDLERFRFKVVVALWGSRCTLGTWTSPRLCLVRLAQSLTLQTTETGPASTTANSSSPLGAGTQASSPRKRSSSSRNPMCRVRLPRRSSHTAPTSRGCATTSTSDSSPFRSGTPPLARPTVVTTSVARGTRGRMRTARWTTGPTVRRGAVRVAPTTVLVADDPMGPSRQGPDPMGGRVRTSTGGLSGQGARGSPAAVRIGQVVCPQGSSPCVASTPSGCRISQRWSTMVGIQSPSTPIETLR